MTIEPRPLAFIHDRHATAPAPRRAGDRMTGRCGWCKELQGVAAAGCMGTGSGPGALVRACRNCLHARGIAAFAGHPGATGGRPRFRDGR